MSLLRLFLITFLFLSAILLSSNTSSAFFQDPENESVYLLQEDVFVNNIPLQLPYPTYEKSYKNFKITQLEPQAERLYLGNLKLNFEQNTLKKVSDALWIGPQNSSEKTYENAPKSREAKEDGVPFDKLKNEATVMWARSLRSDNMRDFFFDLRQWIKRYEEDLMYPVIYKNVVIARNEQSVICLDTLNGEKIWDFSIRDKRGHEYYRTSRHPHQNSYGYEFLLSDDVVFSELGGAFAAIDISDILEPKLIWKTSLGEYTACSKPVDTGAVITVGLVNARGEIWFCGFNRNTGDLEWNSYVGISSFLSPVCTISLVRQNRLFVGTNNGILVSLDPRSGKILWVKKYAPKKYNLYDYWNKEYFKDKVLNRGSIPYDTQFISAGHGNFLYYKPRESEYVYKIDTISGKTEAERSFASGAAKILGIVDGKLVLLENSDRKRGRLKVKAIDLESDRIAHELYVEAGNPEGVEYINQNQIAFKIGRLIHFMKIEEEKLSHKTVDVSARKAGKLWLLSCKGKFALLGKNNTVLCLDMFKADRPYKHNNIEYAGYLERRKKLLKNLETVLNSKKIGKSAKVVKEMANEIKTLHIPANIIFSIIEKNAEALRHRSFRQLVKALLEEYADDVVRYQDVNIRFVNFMHGSGLANSCFMERHITKPEEIAHLKPHGNFDIKGENMFLIPVKTKKGRALLDFFLVLKNDQLLCVSENGNITWTGRICCNRHYKNKKTAGARHFENIEAYLYEGTLVINDFSNIVARDVRTGTYLWSMTNLESPGLRLHTTGTDLVVINDKKAYDLNPFTGYVKNFRQLQFNEQILSYDRENRIYILSRDATRLKILDKNLRVLKDLHLDYIKHAGIDEPQMYFIDDYISVYSNPNLYLIDQNDGAMKNKIFIGNITGATGRGEGVVRPGDWTWTSERGDICSFSGAVPWYVEANKNTFVVLAPFKELTIDRLAAGTKMLRNKFDLKQPRENCAWKPVTHPWQNIHGFFVGDGYVLVPRAEGNKFFIVSVDLAKGEILWETPVNGIDGLICNFYSVETAKGNVTSIISTVNLGKRVDLRPIFVDVDSKSFNLDVKSGAISGIKTLPSVGETGFKKMGIVETENYLVYGIYGNLIKMKRKTREKF